MFYDWDAIDEAGNLTGVSLLVSISLIVLFVQRLVSKAQITSTVYFFHEMNMISHLSVDLKNKSCKHAPPPFRPPQPLPANIGLSPFVIFHCSSLAYVAATCLETSDIRAICFKRIVRWKSCNGLCN